MRMRKCIPFPLCRKCTKPIMIQYSMAGMKQSVYQKKALGPICLHGRQRVIDAAARTQCWEVAGVCLSYDLHWLKTTPRITYYSYVLSKYVCCTLLNCAPSPKSLSRHFIMNKYHRQFDILENPMLPKRHCPGPYSDPLLFRTIFKPQSLIHHDPEKERKKQLLAASPAQGEGK
jgi:hypothetical protein